MFCLRPFGVDSSWKHLLASLMCVSFLSTQNKLFPYFWLPWKNSRKDKCRGLIGISLLTGILSTEYSKSSLQLMSSLRISRKCASEAIERRLSRTTILPTISRNLLVRLSFSSPSLSLNNWFKMGRYVLSSRFAVWYSKKISKRFLGLSCFSPIYQQVVVAKINNGIAISMRAWIWSLLGQSRGSECCLPTALSSCSENKVMSFWIVAFGMLWRIMSWYIPTNIYLKLRQMWSSGLLVINIRNKTGQWQCICVKSWRITCTSSSRSHSSNTSITIINPNAFERACVVSKSGCSINFLNWFFRDFSEIVGSTSIAFIIPGINPGIWVSRSVARVVKNLYAVPRSFLPFLKKKLVPSWPLSANTYTTVCAIVDFLVPAIPVSQNIGLPFLSFAHLLI